MYKRQALGIVILSGSGGFSKYSSYLIGDILTVSQTDLLVLLLVLIGVYILWAVFYLSLIHIFYECYNVDLKDNSEITLEELLGPDYIDIANESIKEQIAADDSGLYFDEEMGGFTTITPETKFYICLLYTSWCWV